MAAAIAGSNEILQTRWVLGSVPEKPAGGGYPMPKLSDFKAIREPIPAAADIQDGHVLIKHDFLSADPYVVAYRMTKPEHVDKTIWAGAAGTVVASKSKKFGVGDIVVGGGMCGSSEYSVRPEDTLDKIIYDTTKVPLSLSLGLLGMPGCTAFIGVTDLLGDDLTGKTVVVTGAAGAVGSAAGQIAKRLGAAKVIGLCGSAAKVERCLKKYKYDNCLNYKSATLDAELKALAPFHCFYDNTGGPAASSIKALMVDGGRVAKVGSIGGPSSDAHDGRLQIKGFYAGGVKDQWPAAIKTMAGWVHEGKLHYDETVLVGIESIPAAFIAQRTGKNTGKMIVDLASSDAGPANKKSKPTPAILVVGATGGLGAHIVKQSLARGYSVTGIIRSMEKAEKKFTAQERSEISFKIGDLSDASFLSAAFAGVDVVVEVLSNSLRPHGIKPLLDAAVTAGVGTFVVCGGAGELEVSPGTTMADTNPAWGTGWLTRITNLHLAVRKMAFPYASKGMTVAQIVPPAMSEGPASGRYVPATTGKWTPNVSAVTYGDVAHCMLEALHTGEVNQKLLSVIPK